MIEGGLKSKTVLSERSLELKTVFVERALRSETVLSKRSLEPKTVLHIWAFKSFFAVRVCDCMV